MEAGPLILAKPLGENKFNPIHISPKQVNAILFLYLTGQKKTSTCIYHPSLLASNSAKSIDPWPSPPGLT